jgi:hypothetical protein
MSYVILFFLLSFQIKADSSRFDLNKKLTQCVETVTSKDDFFCDLLQQLYLKLRQEENFFHTIFYYYGELNPDFSTSFGKEPENFLSLFSVRESDKTLLISPNN